MQSNMLGMRPWTPCMRAEVEDAEKLRTMMRKLGRCTGMTDEFATEITRLDGAPTWCGRVESFYTRVTEFWSPVVTDTTSAKPLLTIMDGPTERFHNITGVTAEAEWARSISFQGEYQHARRCLPMPRRCYGDCRGQSHSPYPMERPQLISFNY